MKKLQKVENLKILILFILFISLFIGASCSTNMKMSLKKQDNQIFCYGLNGKLLKIIDLKTKKITYQKKWEEFFQLVEKKRFLIANSNDGLVDLSRYVNALVEKEIYYDVVNQKPIISDAYAYNQFGMLKAILKDDFAVKRYYYNQLGLLVEQKYYSNVTVQLTAIERDEFQLNNRGQLEKVIIYSNNELVRKTNYKYNPQGLVREINVFSHSFDTNQIRLQEREEYFYDQQKRLIEIKAYPYGGDMKYQKKFLKSRYSYNPEGIIIKKESYDHQEQLKEYWQYQYNEKGLLISEKRFSKEGQYQDETKLEYDELGRLSQESWYNGVKLKSMKKYIY